jgi:DNA-binding NtrC family response regulator
MIRVLIVDDEAKLTEAVREHLTLEKMRVLIAPSAREALLILGREAIDVVILDVRLPDMDGFEFLLKLTRTYPTIGMIVLTGSVSVSQAIRSMKLGASDYLIKPCGMLNLSKAVSKAYEKNRPHKTVVPEERFSGAGDRDEFIGASDEIERIRSLIKLVAPSNAPVLILGETGTGKDLVAMAVHDLSPRSGRPFITVNSSTLQETILESELFGYKKGAFTGAENDKAGLLELADHGTFFVDEVGDMSLSIQAKVLRALETGTFRKLGAVEERKVDVRFIFATNKDLNEEVKEGRFRKDLFFRIGALPMCLPPLRQRREDIPLLTAYFLDKFSKNSKKKTFSEEVLNLLTAYQWPGNVRELANVIKRSLLMSASREEILVDDLGEGIVEAVYRSVKSACSSGVGRVVNLAEMEEKHIRRVLSSVKGNKTKAARLLGISRTALYEKLGTIQAGA